MLATDAFGNAIGNSVAGKHREAAEKARVEQARVEQASVEHVKSFAGVGPIFDWRNKAVKYDMSGYTPIFDWRNKPIKYDFSEYSPIFDWRTKPMKSDFSGDEPLMRDYLSTASNNTPMPDIGMCSVPKVDNSAYYAAMSKGMELKPAMTPEQRARANEIARLRAGFVQPGVREGSFDGKIARSTNDALKLTAMGYFVPIRSAGVATTIAQAVKNELPGATISGMATFSVEYGKSGDLVKSSQKATWAFGTGLIPVGGGVRRAMSKAYLSNLTGNSYIDGKSMLDINLHISAMTAAGLTGLTYPINNFIPGTSPSYQQLLFSEFVQQSGSEFSAELTNPYGLKD